MERKFLDTSFTMIENTSGDYDDEKPFDGMSNCKIAEDKEGVRISCEGVNIEEISPKFPPETVNLEISNSYTPILNSPFFKNLTKLLFLKLTNNSHKYITSKAFTGLENLKALNLSTNSIIVLSKAFTYIPKLEYLDLSNNFIIKVGTIATAVAHLGYLRNLTLNNNYKIRTIFKDSFLPLRNSSLERISLFNTTLVKVEEGAFGMLRRLRFLELSVNYLDEEALKNVTVGLQNTSIEYFLARTASRLKRFPYEAVFLLRNTMIRYLNLGNNYFEQLQRLPEIPSLLSLRLSRCSIREFSNDAFNDLPSLEELLLDGNSIFLINEAISSLSQLRILSLENQSPDTNYQPRLMINSFTFINMSMLSYLSFFKTIINNRITRYTLVGLKRIETLILRSTGVEEIDDYAFETLSNLITLDLQGNGLAHITNFTFFGLGNIRILLLSFNKITFFRYTYPFQNSNLVSILFLHRNAIQHIPPRMFSNLSSLKFLSLFLNALTAWNETVLSAMSNITTLLLARNLITHITPEMMLDFSSVSGTLDLSKNPFNCSNCGMKEFQHFLNTTNLTWFKQSTETTKSSYSCSFPESVRGKPLMEVDISESHCLVNPGINISILIAAGVSSSVFLMLLLAIPCYFYRWYVRYWVFHLRTSIKERRRSSEGSHHYLYDAFVCYNAADTSWVVQHLIPALEEQEPRFRLCIHERDFQVGRLITDNILDAIESSRKVILLLTDTFAKSEWCMFELHLAQHKLFDDSRDVLVLVKIKAVDKKIYSKDLKYLERTRTCFTWTDNPVGEKVFWNKMRKFLGQNISSKQKEIHI